MSESHLSNIHRLARDALAKRELRVMLAVVAKALGAQRAPESQLYTGLATRGLAPVFGHAETQ